MNHMEGWRDLLGLVTCDVSLHMCFVSSCFERRNITFLLVAWYLWVSQANLIYMKGKKETLSVADFKPSLLLIHKTKFYTQKKENIWCTKRFFWIEVLLPKMHLSTMGTAFNTSNNRCYLERFLARRHMYSNYYLYFLTFCWFTSHDSPLDIFLLWESGSLYCERIQPFSFFFSRMLQLRLTSWARCNTVLKPPDKQQCESVCVHSWTDLLKEMHPYSQRAAVRLSSPLQW